MQSTQEFLKYLDQYEYAQSQIKIYLSHFENQIDVLLQSIAAKKNVDDAFIEFQTLENIQAALSKALYSAEIMLNEKLHEFVNEYDRLDDENEKTRLFKNIRTSLRV